MTALPQNLRLPDLIAKTAKVTLKDTVRVLHAVQAVGRLYGIEMVANPQIVDQFGRNRPTPENIAACEQASFTLKEGDIPGRAEIDNRLDAIEQL